ncbi:GNAT family N-acetyltransferase [Bacillus cereus]|uniref:GNAT family N-acetyltransferase n=2 Tax=Bacillaceae TaxID=186817 RepID=UPI000B4ABCAC|nr:GNAT family N-acetyltransferase [Bacillus cereus]MCU5026666.1 GNAT family N-acetyltransferase [Bacillus cereus]MDA1974801.1 GNAT family N-acetyltransferase [Bacillus cereus]MDA2440755.1 GNAT family N-acetyltransferase [Bacillus cereus]MDA2446751.1 GNAT family N-acetyltransferase [Bacillus cereus]MDA2661574.1 GNAT family N-acetyltransferase [Bacillus cereus]
MSNEVLPFIVRMATDQDFKGISKLKEQVHQLHIEGRPDLYANASASLDRNTYETWLNDTTIKVFVVEDNNKEILGYMILDIKEPSNNPILLERKVLFIRNIGVSKICRGTGIGKTLVQKAFEYAKEIQVTSVELNVLEFNENAIQFYEKLGFKTKSRQMECSLTND